MSAVDSMTTDERVEYMIGKMRNQWGEFDFDEREADAVRRVFKNSPSDDPDDDRFTAAYALAALIEELGVWGDG